MEAYISSTIKGRRDCSMRDFFYRIKQNTVIQETCIHVALG